MDSGSSSGIEPYRQSIQAKVILIIFLVALLPIIQVNNMNFIYEFICAL